MDLLILGGAFVYDISLVAVYHETRHVRLIMIYNRYFMVLQRLAQNSRTLQQSRRLTDSMFVNYWPRIRHTLLRVINSN